LAGSSPPLTRQKFIMRTFNSELDHIDPRWKEGRDYQLVCGLDCPLNYREEDARKNTAKSNRFLPWRWCRDEIGVVPEEPGDLAYFLVGADIEKDIPGEWMLMEFLSEEWFFATKSTVGSANYEKDNTNVLKQWETFRANPDLLNKRNQAVGEGGRKWRKENPEKAKEADRKRVEGHLRSRKEDPGKWDEANATIAKKTKEKWEEDRSECLERLQTGFNKWREENPEELRANLKKCREGYQQWKENNPEEVAENFIKMNEGLDVWRKENPEKVQGIVKALGQGRELWERTEDYKRYSQERSERMKRQAKERWQCKISGRISTAAGLSHIQKSLGIDHKDRSNRVKIS
jgi:hypothetical protein